MFQRTNGCGGGAAEADDGLAGQDLQEVPRWRSASVRIRISVYFDVLGKKCIEALSITVTPIRVTIAWSKKGYFYRKSSDRVTLFRFPSTVTVTERA